MTVERIPARRAFNNLISRSAMEVGREEWQLLSPAERDEAEAMYRHSEAATRTIARQLVEQNISEADFDDLASQNDV